MKMGEALQSTLRVHLQSSKNRVQGLISTDQYLEYRIFTYRSLMESSHTKTIAFVFVSEF